MVIQFCYNFWIWKIWIRNIFQGLGDGLLVKQVSCKQLGPKFNPKNPYLNSHIVTLGRERQTDPCGLPHWPAPYSLHQPNQWVSGSLRDSASKTQVENIEEGTQVHICSPQACTHRSTHRCSHTHVHEKSHFRSWDYLSIKLTYYFGVLYLLVYM